MLPTSACTAISSGTSPRSSMALMPISQTAFETFKVTGGFGLVRDDCTMLNVEGKALSCFLPSFVRAGHDDRSSRCVREPEFIPDIQVVL
jgi:hypothetical protein